MSSSFPSWWPKRRGVYIFGFLCCAALMAFALYLQYKLGEDPCPLCIFQRVAVIALGLVLLLAGLHNPQRGGNKFYALSALFIAAIGAGIAGRHVWLQNLPKDQVPECGPGLSYMLESSPFLQVFKKVLQGTGECAEVGWTFLRLSIPEWTLLCFLLLGLLTLSQLWNRRA